MLKTGAVVETPKGQATVVEQDDKRGLVRIVLQKDIGRRNAAGQYDNRTWWIPASECVEVEEEVKE